MSESTTHCETARATGEIDEIEQYRLLADEQRRAVVDALEDRQGPVPLADLVAAVAAATGYERENVEIQLHHVHLPMFEEAGLCNYDRDEAQVERYRPVAALRP